MNIFEFFEKISSQKSDFEDIDDKLKSSHSFLLNRYMSAEFPNHAHLFNKHSVSGILISDYWRKIIHKKRYSRVPGYFYLKTSSKHSEENKKLTNLKPEIINKICLLEQIKKSDFLEFIKLEPEKSLELIKSYEKALKNKIE